MIPRFDKRSTDTEIMDDLLCSGEVVHQTLRELDTINRLLGGNNVTLSAVKTLLQESGKKSLTIADLGCGSGDMVRRISEWGKQNSFNLSLTGIDANPNIVAYARDKGKPDSNINFIACDVFSDEFSSRHHDIVVATLFAHHFTDLQLVALFRSLNSTTSTGIVINDIHRHCLAYYSIRLLTKLFSRSSMVRFDAPLSVLRAFKKRELVDILREAGIGNYNLRWRWAFRWQLIIVTA